MAFVDDLALELFVLSLVGVISVYMTAMVYVEYRKGNVKDIEGILRQGVFPLGLLGVFIFIMGLFAEMTWPLPGSYNILFYDPFMIIGIVILSMSVAIYLRQKLQYVGILAFFSGWIAIFYGINAYIDNMTQSPIAMLGLYVAFGLTGVFTWPTTYIYDVLPSKGKVSGVWTILLLIFWVGLIVSSVLSAFTAIEAVPQHLLNPP